MTIIDFHNAGRRGRRWLNAGFSVALLIGGSFKLAAEEAAEFRPTRVLQAQPPITSFQVKPVSDVGDLLNPSETVLGVTVGQESRAYPINMLTGPSREILNDTLGGQAIAATW